MRRILLLTFVLSGCTRTPAIWKGVYTAEQAARGQKVYEGHCAVCHNPSLAGLSGAFRGSGFVREWREDNLENLFVRIRKTMPAENPASLSEMEYLDVLTYILSENGFPSG
jgi:mono/diheme cytochrome c family protein